MQPLSFFAWLGGTAAGLACLAVALGVVVDPYRIYGTAAVPGWNALKPRIYNQASIAKTYQLERVGPRTLLLGNSRVEIGLDPESSRWPPEAHPVFNGALAGANLRTSLDMLRDAFAAAHPPETVLLGLDFLDFLQTPDSLPAPPEPIGPDERRLLVDRGGKPNPQRSLQVWRDRVVGTLTIDAVLDDLATLVDQDPETSETMTPLGFNPLNEYRLFAARQGYYTLFAQKNEVYRSQYRHHPAPDFLDPPRFASFRYLHSIIALAMAHNVRLILFTHPYHADYLDMLHEVGLWESFENWKRSLVKVIETAARARPGYTQLFDFAGYNEFTTERVPLPGDRHAVMRWYWEAGHYKPALGNEMLDTMLGRAAPFGVVLTSANVGAALQKIRESRSFFRTKVGSVVTSPQMRANARRS